ncbi:MAG: ABC transporter permease [Xanthomonadales bacterium]|nr:ABC transporter permease [Xanthomonadales bacterium]
MKQASSSLDRARHFMVLVLFKTLAELRGERQRTYLGFLWWLFEPAFLMLVYYLVFGKFLNYGGQDYVAVLLCGLVLWQWFGNAVIHCATSIQTAMPLARTVKVPMALFPLAVLLADTIKFAFVFVVLILVLVAMGYAPTFAYVWLIPVLVAEFVFTCGVCFIVAAVVPMLPDLNFVVGTALQALMFLSAVFFQINTLSPVAQHWLAYDPMATIIDNGRNVILFGQPPALEHIAIICGFAIIALACGLMLVHILTPRYPKLAD